MALDRTGALVVLAILSFLPAVAYALWLRNQERFEREPVRAVLGALFYGSTAGVAVAAVLESLVHFDGVRDASTLAILAFVVVSPPIEEFAKALGLPLVRRQMDELEDGIVYGTAIGLGFAATETVVYANAALSGSGAGLAFETIAIRTVSSLLLHAAAAAVVGFGYGYCRLTGRSMLHLVPYFVVAVGLHAGFNLLVLLSDVWGLVADIGLVVGLGLALRFRLRQLDGKAPMTEAALAAPAGDP
ncbi:MAG: PrsW family intramembrane metalloprotease [bacterium]